MEQSLLSFTYKGSIPEAISEAKVQRKLFVVYVSGEDAESARMEETTWRDFRVSESLSKYCIFLHVLEGSTDAFNFSTIYPQGSIPCITAVGYNGVKLWGNEGYIGAEDLALGLEKAWLSLHIQETTASYLTAALAIRNSEPSGSHASSTASIEQGSSARTAANCSSDEHNQGSDIPLVSSEILEDKICCEDIAEKIDDDKPSLGPDFRDDLGRLEDGKSCSSTEAAKGSGNPSSSHFFVDNSDDCKSSHFGKGNSISEEAANYSSDIAEIQKSNSNKSNVTSSSSDEKPHFVADIDIDLTCGSPSGSESMDVHLSIRLPNSISLQHKFSVTSTLRVVKEYVDENQDGNINSYNLAIPYPRKVFTDQDLDKSLSELELVGRQALMVVPLGRGKNHNRGDSMSQCQPSSTDDSSDGNNGGYFGIVRRILSYVNPLSYLGGTFRSSDPIPPPNNLARTEGPNYRDSTNQNTSAGSRTEGRSRRPTSSSFGGNIHTLKRDEDDDRFSDRNSFWNGNSTQYGGDGGER